MGIIFLVIAGIILLALLVKVIGSIHGLMANVLNFILALIPIVISVGAAFLVSAIASPLVGAAVGVVMLLLFGKLFWKRRG